MSKLLDLPQPPVTILKGSMVSYKKTVMRVVRLFNNTCGEQIGEQIDGEQIADVVDTVY